MWSISNGGTPIGNHTQFAKNGGCGRSSRWCITLEKKGCMEIARFFFASAHNETAESFTTRSPVHDVMDGGKRKNVTAEKQIIFFSP